MSKFMKYSLDNFNGHFEAKKGQKMLFLWARGLNCDQFLISIFPLNFIFDIGKIIVSGPRSYLDGIYHLLRAT